MAKKQEVAAQFKPAAMHQLNTDVSVTSIGSAMREKERIQRSTRYMQGSMSQVSLHESVSSAKKERKVTEA